jgi:hypothetical protein
LWKIVRSEVVRKTEALALRLGAADEEEEEEATEEEEEEEEEWETL